MKKLLVAAVIAGSFISFEAQAQERAGSAAPGALVLGPVGAVAGALIGYAWGDGQSAPRSRVRRTARSGPVTEQPAAARVTPPPVSEKFLSWTETVLTELAMSWFTPSPTKMTDG